jgi:hypothetical protein
MLFCNSAAFYQMIDSFFETLAIIVCISFETIKGTVYSTGESTVYCTVKHICLTAKKLVPEKFMIFCSAVFYHKITSIL